MKWPDGSKAWRGPEALKGAGGGLAGAAGEQTLKGGAGGGGGSIEVCTVPGCPHDGLHAHLPGGVTVAGGGAGRAGVAMTAGGAVGGGGYPGASTSARLLAGLIPGIPQGSPGPVEPDLPEGLAEDLRAILDAIALLPQHAQPRELPSGDVLAYLSRCDCGTQALTRKQHRVWRCEQCEATGDGFERNTIGVRVPEADARAWAAINEEAQRRGRALWADAGHTETGWVTPAAEASPVTLTVAVGAQGEPSGVEVDGPAVRVEETYWCHRCGRQCGPEGHPVCA